MFEVGRWSQRVQVERLGLPGFSPGLTGVFVGAVVFGAGKASLLRRFSGGCLHHDRPTGDIVQQIFFLQGVHRRALNELRNNKENLFQSRCQERSRKRFATQDGIFELPVVRFCCRFTKPLGSNNVVKNGRDNLLR